MRYLRPYASGTAASSQWLLAPEEGAGCGVRLVFGPGDSESYQRPEAERFALVLRGAVALQTLAGEQTAKAGDLIFIPAGVEAQLSAFDEAAWAEIEAPVSIEGASDTIPRNGLEASVISIDQSRFEGQGFAYQSLVDRSTGSRSMRMNALQVEPGAGSPDYHIHSFAQIYLIQEGEMTVDIGYERFTAGADTLVFLPAGVVHRNFNASSGIERHVSLLVPEPAEGKVFDYAVTIHAREAELLTEVPKRLS